MTEDRSNAVRLGALGMLSGAIGWGLTELSDRIGLSFRWTPSIGFDWLEFTPRSLFPGLTFGLVIGILLRRRGKLEGLEQAAYLAAAGLAYACAYRAVFETYFFVLSFFVLSLKLSPDFGDIVWSVMASGDEAGTFAVCGIVAGLVDSVLLGGMSKLLFRVPARLVLGWPVVVSSATGALLGFLGPHRYDARWLLAFLMLWQGAYAASLAPLLRAARGDRVSERPNYRSNAARGALVCAALLLGASSANAQGSEDFDVCSQALVPDATVDFGRVVDQCTRAIKSGRLSTEALAAAYRARAIAHARKGDQEKGIQDEDEAIRLKPDYAEAYFNRGQAFIPKQLDRAIADFDQAIRLKPGYAEAYSFRAVAYFLKAQPLRAIEDLNEAIRLKPDANAYQNRGGMYLATGQFDRAIADFDQALKLKPDWAEAYKSRGNAYAAKGQRYRGIEDLDRAIRLKPELAESYAVRGDIYAADGQGTRAIQDYDQAIRLKPGLAPTYLSRAMIYSAMGEAEHANQDFDQAFKLAGPQTIAFLIQQADNLRRQKDYVHAIVLLDQAIRLDRSSARAYANRGVVYYLKQDYDRSLGDYDEAIKLDPSDAFAWTMRGELYRIKGQYDRVIADEDQAIKLKPNYIAFYARGIALYARRDYDRAIHDFDEAIKLDPKSTDALFLRGKAYKDKGQYDRAIQDFDAVIALDPKNVDAFTIRGNTYRAKGEFNRAMADYDQALKLNPADTLALKNRALAVQKQGVSVADPAAPTAARQINVDGGK